jgi:hypothetical protein
MPKFYNLHLVNFEFLVLFNIRTIHHFIFEFPIKYYVFSPPQNYLYTLPKINGCGYLFKIKDRFDVCPTLTFECQR